MPETSSYVLVASTDFTGDPLFTAPDLATGSGDSAVESNPFLVTDAQSSTSSTSANSSSQIAAVSPELLPTLEGMPLLEQLALLPDATLSDFVSDNSSVVHDLVATPPAVEDVSQWWSGLTGDAQDSLFASAPEVVGNLNGVPFAIRDAANRSYLGDTIEAVNNNIAKGGGRSQIIDDRRKLHMLSQIKDALVSTPNGPKRHLLSVDSSGYGTASIVIGDLSSADYVSYLIPGMFFTVDGQIVDWAASGQYFYDSERSWLKALRGANPDAATSSVAVVAWLGYQTPSLVDAGSLVQARTGRDAIASALQGLQTLRKGNEPFTSIIAHSYGSTAAMMALADYNITIDALAMVGSPGSATHTAAGLHVKGNNVYAGEAAWDPIPNSAYFGSDPGSTEFGAHVFGVGGGTDPLTHRTLAGSTGHNEYFAVGSESMRNLALVGINEGKLVMGGNGAVMAKSFSGLTGRS